MNGFVEILPHLLNTFFIIQTVSAGAMCIYGYKWRKGLIATLSIYIGIFIGVLIASAIIKQNYENITLGILMIPIITIVFYWLAYSWIALNHFLTGFLVANKITFMVIYNLMRSDVIDFDFGVLMIVPLLVGIVAGIIICCYFTYIAVLSCIVYIGTVELVTGIADLINKSLFVSTGDIRFIFDIEDLLLKLVGVDVPSFWEVIFILLIGSVSFSIQKTILEEEGINLSNVIVDDR